MADALNHILVAKRCFSMLDDTEAVSLIKDNYLQYLLGAMGMDLFFYYKVLSSKENYKTIRNIGSVLHNQNPDVLFDMFTSYMEKIEDVREKNALLAYVYGVITHHATDSTCHPFIIYYSGGGGYEDGKDYDQSHKRFEQLLDTLYYKYEGEAKFDFDGFKSLPKWFICALGGLYNSVIQKILGFELSLDIYFDMMCDMIKIQSLTKIKSKTILGVVMFMEKFTKEDYPFSQVIAVATKEELSKDIMNLSNEMWVYPMAENMHANMSFPELMGKSVNLAKDHICAFAHELKEGEPNCKKIFKSVGFETGLAGEKLPYKNLKRKI